MPKLNDEELIAALMERFDANRRAVNDLRELTGKLETTNRKLQEAEGLKGRFLSNIRNEINNPLAAIMGFAYQLKTGTVSAEQSARNGRLIYDEAFELNFQLENIFAPAGLEAGQESPTLARIDVVASLDEVIKEFEHRGHEKGVEILCSAPQSLLFVTDPRFLQIILRNLIANALEFSPRWGAVTVDISADGAELRIAVRDDGPGIDSVHHETVFDRFRQLDGGSCKKHRGHGLGLSICRALAELSGGTVDIDSAPGNGSTFTLILPRPTGDAASQVTEGSPFFFDKVETY